MLSKTEIKFFFHHQADLFGEASDAISYFPPLWTDTNSDIKDISLGLNRTGRRIIVEKQHHTEGEDEAGVLLEGKKKHFAVTIYYFFCTKVKLEPTLPK